ncbi:MAG: hypothetical protein ACRD00_04950, partial [Thermoanaerobaculia bacterium]
MARARAHRDRGGALSTAGFRAASSRSQKGAAQLWRIAPVEPAQVAALAQAAGRPELVARLLLARGVT